MLRLFTKRSPDVAMVIHPVANISCHLISIDTIGMRLHCSIYVKSEIRFHIKFYMHAVGQHGEGGEGQSCGWGGCTSKQLTSIGRSFYQPRALCMSSQSLNLNHRAVHERSATTVVIRRCTN